MSVLLVVLAVWICPLPRLGVLTWVKSRLQQGLRRRRDEQTEQECDWAAALAGELLAGKEPSVALQESHRSHSISPHAARAARLGGDIAAALRKDAAGEGSLLAAVAGVWDIGHRSGLGLAEVLQQLCDGEARSRDVRRTLQVELAGPRATARLMSLLPALGLGLGLVLGANPLEWLTTSPIGLVVLAAGLTANVLGYRWIRAIVRRVEEVL